MILKEKDSRAMSLSQFTVNKIPQKIITSSKFSTFQKAFIGNVAITFIGVEILLFDNNV